MTTPVEPTAADRALERMIVSLMKRIDDLEKLVARNTDDAAAALAAATGHEVRLEHLEWVPLVSPEPAYVHTFATGDTTHAGGAPLVGPGIGT